MQIKYYKYLSVVCFMIFLITMIKIESIILLGLTGFFVYRFTLKTLKSLTQKDLYQLIPKTWKKQIEEQSFINYVSNLQTVKETPILNYFVSILSSQMNQQRQVRSQAVPNSYEIAHSTSKKLEIEADNTRCTKMIRQSNENSASYRSDVNRSRIQLYSQQMLIKAQTKDQGNLTTCESNYNPGKKSQILPRKTSIIIKKKFAQQSSSIQQSQRNLHKKLPRTNSQLKLQQKAQPSHLSISQHMHNPLKTLQEYMKALMWMMKRLLSIKKMTNRVEQASTVRIMVVASFFWIAIFWQIKRDSKNGKLFFKFLHVFSCVVSVLAGLGATTMLALKVHKALKTKDQPIKKQIKLLK